MPNDSVQIEELPDKDREGLHRELQLGRSICDFYLDAGGSVDIATLDRILDLWGEDQRTAKPSANEISLGLGSLVSEQLRERFALRWVVVTDRHGCDLGLVDDRSGWQFFPRHWIAKRIGSFVVGDRVLEGIVSALRRDGKLRDG